MARIGLSVNSSTNPPSTRNSENKKKRKKYTLGRYQLGHSREFVCQLYRVSIESLYNFKNLLQRQMKRQTSGNYYKM